MAALSDYLENYLVDGLFRGGALNSSGTVNSTAVVKGIWTATTAYVAGDTVVPHANMTGAGGKFMRCTTAGTSGSTNTLAVPAVGSTLSDGSVTWTTVSGMPSIMTQYYALLVINKGARANSAVYASGDCIQLTANDARSHVYRCTTAGTAAASQGTLYPGVPGEAITDGTAVMTEIQPVLDSNTGFPAGLTEVTGGAYARQPVACSLANYSGTQSTGSTTASTGSGGTTSNNASVTFPTPTANWASGSAQVAILAKFDQLTGGNLLSGAALTVPKTINNADSPPSFAAAADSFQIDN